MTSCLTQLRKDPRRLNTVICSPTNTVNAPRPIFRIDCRGGESSLVVVKPTMPPIKMPSALRIVPDIAAATLEKVGVTRATQTFRAQSVTRNVPDLDGKKSSGPATAIIIRLEAEPS